MNQLAFMLGGAQDGARRLITPQRELGAYEWLWSQRGATFKRIADRFREEPEALPSDLVAESDATAMGAWVTDHFRARGIERWGVRVHRGGEYPEKLRDARHPVELLYFRGYWEAVEARCVSVVGTRSPTDVGRRRARKLTRMLVDDGWTIVSGLAAGVDTVAHTTALREGGSTIAVIGTPICETYPPENAELQSVIAQRNLVISQVPVHRYHQASPKTNRFFFPERNVTMSALTEATIIVEAGETSGTRIQARAALQQGRQVFILDSCFRPELTWPWDFERKGAIRVREFEQIRDALAAPVHRS